VPLAGRLDLLHDPAAMAGAGRQHEGFEARRHRMDLTSSAPAHRAFGATAVQPGPVGSPVQGLSEAENSQAWQTWQRLQAELVGLSSRARHVVAERSDHDVRLRQPHLVVDAIRHVARAARR